MLGERRPSKGRAARGATLEAALSAPRQRRYIRNAGGEHSCAFGEGTRRAAREAARARPWKPLRQALEFLGSPRIFQDFPRTLLGFY